MIKTTAMLLEELAHYVNPAAKIKRMVRAGQLVPVIRGIYETERSTPGHYLSGVIYGPSYLSFEYALSWHDLIPEAVYTYTSATCGKGRKKKYETPFGIYTYRDVPMAAFPYGTELYIENGSSFVVASAEKAICDLLYARSPCGSKKELKQLLFDDLRIEESAFRQCDLDTMMALAELYHTSNHRQLLSVIKEVKRDEQHH